MNPALLIGAAALIYLWYSSQSSTTSSASGLPSDAVAVLTTSGTALTSGGSYVWYSPSGKQVYTSATAPTSAQISAAASYWSTSAGQQIYAALTGQSTTASQPTTSTGTTAGTSSGTTTSGTQTVAISPSGSSTPANVQPATFQTPGGGTAATPANLAGLWAAIQQWAASDSAFTTSGGVVSGSPYHWSFYVSYIWPNAPSGWSGTWPPDLSSVFPGVDLTQPMTASTFWAGMGAALQKAGLSGLYGMAGLGLVDNTFRVRGRGGWAA